MAFPRSYQPELLDLEGIPFEAILQNMRELNTINTLLGGHSITTRGFSELAGQLKMVTVCEIGCGGGDNLAAIKKYCDARQIPVKLIGVDLKQECIEVAKQHPLLKDQATFICSDYATVVFTEKPAIVFSSLFCHHFTEAQLLQQLHWMKLNATVGFFINDLHRHWLAFASIRLLTRLFSRSYLVKNDAPLSVKRGFLKTEWRTILNDAGIHAADISWQWAFRHLIVYKK
jgi:2-polyprenyl-3-methyl-5-hydroxy-6-metoxy-1,4-benzoquinol methylase